MNPRLSELRLSGSSIIQTMKITQNCLFCSDYEMTLGKCQKGFHLRNDTVQEQVKLQHRLSSGTDHDTMFVVQYNSRSFHLAELFTYPKEIFVAFDRWGLDNRGFTVLFNRMPHKLTYVSYNIMVRKRPKVMAVVKHGGYKVLAIKTSVTQ